MYQIEVTRAKDALFKVKSKDYEFNVDLKGKGINPPDVFLASLGTCIGVYLNRYCEGAGLELKNFSIKVKADLTKEAPFCFRKVDVGIDLGGLIMDEARKQALLNFLKNCPIHNTLKVNPEVNFLIL